MTGTVSAVAVGAGVVGQQPKALPLKVGDGGDPGVALVLDGIAEGQGLAMAIRSDLPLAAPYGHSGCGSRSSHLQDGGTPAVLAAGDVRGLSEFRAVLVEELSYRARGMAGDLGEGAGGVVVLAGQYRPLARDKQLSRPGRYPGAGQAIEVLPVGSDAEGDGLAEFGREQPEHVGPGQRDRPG
jgi:hypothetical protein